MTTNPYRETCERCVELREELKSTKQHLTDVCDERNTWQKKCNEMKSRTWVRWLTVFGTISSLSFLLSLAIPALVAYAVKPEDPHECRDSAEIIRSQDRMKYCDENAKMTFDVLTVNDKIDGVLVKCTCPRPELERTDNTNAAVE